VLCVCAEASGDALLASLLPELIALAPELCWEGMGGPRAVEAGLKSHLDPSELAAHGLTEALGVLPATLRALSKLRALLPEARALILVDAPELNMRLLKAAAELGVPVAYLAPPQAWAWRSWRAALLREATWVGTLFEFEAEWYRERSVQAVCVGHPMRGKARALNAPELTQDTLSPRRLLILPGSRASSVRRSLPLMLSAVMRLAQRGTPELSRHLTIVVSPWVDDLVRQLLEEWIEPLTEAGYSLELWDSLEPISQQRTQAWVGLCHAGTVTLELGLAGVPFLAIAPLSKLSAWVARRLVKVRYFSLPNLIINAPMCLELNPNECSGDSIFDALVNLLKPTFYLKCKAELLSLQSSMKEPSYKKTARELCSSLNLLRDQS